jgi:hypothetical protein
MKIPTMVRTLAFSQWRVIWQKLGLPRWPSQPPRKPAVQAQEHGPQRAVVLPFAQGSPSIRAEQILRMNLQCSAEPREEAPTRSFLPALHKLELAQRHATLADALSRLGFQVKSKRK